MYNYEKLCFIEKAWRIRRKILVVRTGEKETEETKDFSCEDAKCFNSISELSPVIEKSVVFSGI